MNKRTGEQKLTKKGKPVFQTATVAGRSKPLAPHTCDYCGKAIEVGTPYKWTRPKSGPYGGRLRVRHSGCPTWKPWDLSSAWWARIEQATDDFDVSQAESADDVRASLEDVAQRVKDLAEESREAANNIEQGFGHTTQQSEEAEQRADELDGWADDIERADVPELDDFEFDFDGDVPEEGEEGWEAYAEERLDAWRREVEDAVDVVYNSPV